MTQATELAMPSWRGACSRRAIVRVALGVGVIPTLAACGAAQGGTTPQASRQPATIEFWTPAQDPPQQAVQDQVHHEFEARYPGLTVKMEQLDGWDTLTGKL